MIFHSFSSLYFSGQRRSVLTARLAVLVGAAIALGAGGARAANLPGVFNGRSVAASASNTDLAVQLGTSAQAICPCEGTGGKTVADSTGAITAGPLAAALKVGGTTSTVYATKTATTADEKNTTEIENLNLLGGMITADAVKSVAVLSATKSRISISAGGQSGFTNLKVAGKSYPGTAKPNTVIDLPNIGTLTLNAQTKTQGFTSSSIDVAMLTLTITNPAGVGLPISLPLPSVNLPLGATIEIAHATAGYDRQKPPAAFSGGAYGTLATGTLSGALTAQIGRAALVTLNCEGTQGQVVASGYQGVNAQNIVVVGHARSTAQSGRKNGGAYAVMTSTVNSLNLLGGLIKGTNLTAIAKETLINGKMTASVAGSGFDKLTILGVPLPTNAAPNTGRTLPGIGKVIVNEQIPGTKPGQYTTVNGLHILVTTANLLKIPVGTELVVAHATVRVAPLPS